MTDEKRGRGRPRTRLDEASMFALWRAVREEIALRGARNVSQACERLVERRAVVVRNATGDIADKVDTAGTLRQRYAAANKARNDAARYPILHQRAALLEQDLEIIKAGREQMAETYAALTKDGHARDGSTLPVGSGDALHVVRLKLAIDNEYTPTPRPIGRPPRF